MNYSMLLRCLGYAEALFCIFRCCICPAVRKNAIFTDEGDSFCALIRI